MADLEEHQEQDKKVFTGFHFIEMEFSWKAPQTGAPDRQLVVAVRMPEGRNNVSDLSILQQNFHSKHDLAILNGDPNQLASYEYYQTNESYQFNNPPRLFPRWNPDDEGDVGLVHGHLHFSATHVERHLFRVYDQIEELEKMRAWLERYVIPRVLHSISD